KLIQSWKNKPLDETTARQLVSDGKYQIALVIPEKLSEVLESRVNANVEKILSEFSLDESEPEPALTKIEAAQENLPEIKLYFDPAVGESFRNSVKNDIEKLISKVETKKIYSVFEDQMGVETDGSLLSDSAIEFEE